MKCETCKNEVIEEVFVVRNIMDFKTEEDAEKAYKSF